MNEKLEESESEIFSNIAKLNQISKNARYVQYCIKILGLLLCPATH